MPFVQQRHKALVPLERQRELVVACAPLRSNINLSRIVRTAGCLGIKKVIACGAARVIEKIARNSVDDDGGSRKDGEGEEELSGVEIEVHRTLPPVLRDLRAAGYQLVGLEQTTDSTSIFDFRFDRKTALIVGNERSGLDEDELRLLHKVVEIPMYGLPHALNAATATAMALYEYCRQFPSG
ncbi:MAG: TrmH family RNA methyltransferase [Planctomycetia bacterium]|nr:TrmH family RNA methyltransferase [Planctomycetia bacterium]